MGTAGEILHQVFDKATNTLKVLNTAQVVATPNAVVTSISSSATNVTLLALNLTRVGATLFNNSLQNAYIKFGATATTILFSIKMDPGSTLILDINPIYTGRVDAIWDSADGAMLITEFT